MWRRTSDARHRARIDPGPRRETRRGRVSLYCVAKALRELAVLPVESLEAAAARGGGEHAEETWRRPAGAGNSHAMIRGAKYGHTNVIR